MGSSSKNRHLAIYPQPQFHDIIFSSKVLSPLTLKEVNIFRSAGIVTSHKADLKAKKAELKKLDTELAKLEEQKAEADAKAAEEAQKAELEETIQKLMDAGVSAAEILEKLK